MAKTNLPNEKQPTDRRSDPFFTRVAKRRPPPRARSNLKSNSDSAFMQSSSAELDVAEKPKKKVFNKRKWREQKYSLKSKVEQWQNQRKVHLRHAYAKEKSRTKPVNFDVKRIYEEEQQAGEAGGEEDTTESRNETARRSRKSWSRTEDDEKPSKEELLLKIKAEKEEAKELYRKKMIKKRRILNKTTKKGQPIMKGRMELLLEQIQENMNS